MAQPRPPVHKPQPRSDEINPYLSPEISILIHPEALAQFEGPHLEYMKSFFGSVLFENWVKKNQELTEADARALQIGRYSPEQYYQLSKDFRLLWRVWTDLLQLAKDNKPTQSVS